MSRSLSLTTLFALAGAATAAEYGPICQWHGDPTTTMAIHWIQRATEKGTKGNWEVGKAGFGYGDGDDQTVLEDMKGNYRSVYIRRPYAIPKGVPAGAELTMDIRYDDGFVAYLNGVEVARKGVVGSGSAVQEVKSGEADVWERFSLGPVEGGAKGVIAIEGHNDKLGSSDFTLRPRVDVRWAGGVKPVIKEGAQWSYLAGETPEEGWSKRVNVRKEGGGKSVSPYELLLRGSLGANRRWVRQRVASRQFGPTEFVVHSADIKGLKPGRRYEFKIVRRGTELGPWFFETAPAKFEEGMSFVTGGDMFHNRPLLDAMNKRAGLEDPLFALLGGDLAYANGVDGPRWLEWLESWNQNAVAPDGRLVPMVLAIGNHEVKGVAYRPGNAPARSDAPYFYSLFLGTNPGGPAVLDFGDYLSVLRLDSGHTANVASQTEWLKFILAKRQKVPRLFVCYHRPAWGTGVKGDAVEIRREWSPHFERYQVDAVFENDHHIYKRTHPIINGKINQARGIVYLGDGSWGVNTRQIPVNWRKERPYLAEAKATNHLIKVTMGAAGFRYEAKTAAGEVIDGTTRPLRR